MRISYAITVADEVVEFTRLIEFLKEHVKSEEDEIVILVDQGKASEAIYKVLNTLTSESGFPINTTIRVEKFGGDFADWKNKLNSICIGDWIFQLDADEVPGEQLFRGCDLLSASDFGDNHSRGNRCSSKKHSRRYHNSRYPGVGMGCSARGNQLARLPVEVV